MILSDYLLRMHTRITQDYCQRMSEYTTSISSVAVARKWTTSSGTHETSVIEFSQLGTYEDIVFDY